MLPVLLHLLLGVLRALEGEVGEPGQHPAARVHRRHQLVGAAQRHREGELLGTVPGAERGHEAGGSLQPPHHLQTPAGGQLRVWNVDLEIEELY